MLRTKSLATVSSWAKQGFPRRAMLGGKTGAISFAFERPGPVKKKNN
jgi:hypothetical protein